MQAEDDRQGQINSNSWLLNEFNFWVRSDMLKDLPVGEPCQLDGETVGNIAPLLELAYGATLRCKLRVQSGNFYQC